MYRQTPINVSASNTAIAPAIDIAHWYVIYTRARFEKKLYQSLQKAGLEAFLPLVKEKRSWSDRLKTVIVPLIPSYVFVKLSSKEIPRLYGHTGFVRVLKFNGKACTVTASEMQLLQDIVEKGYKVQNIAHCGVGDKVRIVRGPLKGWAGSVETKLSASRIVFYFECIQQMISVEVNMADVEVIK